MLNYPTQEDLQKLIEELNALGTSESTEYQDYAIEPSRLESDKDSKESNLRLEDLVIEAIDKMLQPPRSSRIPLAPIGKIMFKHALKGRWQSVFEILRQKPVLIVYQSKQQLTLLDLALFQENKSVLQQLKLFSKTKVYPNPITFELLVQKGKKDICDFARVIGLMDDKVTVQHKSPSSQVGRLSKPAIYTPAHRASQMDVDPELSTSEFVNYNSPSKMEM